MSDMTRAVSPEPPEDMKKCRNCGEVVPLKEGRFDAVGEFDCLPCIQWMSLDDPPSDEPETCQTCGGDGEVVVCWDDICRARKGCMHGDGMGPCPHCGGEGEL